MIKLVLKSIFILTFSIFISISCLLLYHHRIEIPDIDSQGKMSGEDLTRLILSIRPKLSKLVETRNFKYFRVDVDAPCKMTS